MTAIDMIEQIKALEPRERAKVLDLLLEIEAAQKRVVSMDDRSFDLAADRVVERHSGLLRKLAE